jgi:protein-disulfide isomerase
MNGMKQGLIIGAVAGLFFGFLLGRFGAEETPRQGLLPRVAKTGSPQDARKERKGTRQGRGGARGQLEGTQAAGDVQRYKIMIGRAPQKGPSNALVTIVKFSEFECPFCTRGAGVMDEVVKTYGDKVRVVFKHRPLSFHKNAHLAAQASMAAHEQGKFWQYHDILFKNRQALKHDDLVRYAKMLGLDTNRFEQALKGGKYKAYVDADDRYAVSVGASGTPTFFVNGRQIIGAQPFQRFKQVIDQEITTAKALLARGVPANQLYQTITAKGLASKPAPRPQAQRTAGPRTQIAVGNAPALGPANAKVTIVEFSDFECPFCTRGANNMTALKKEYGDKIRIVFKHLPLSFHKNAHLAAQASMAAHAQGKFWPYHDKLFQNFRNLNRDNFVKWAKELGLDVVRFTQELDGGKYKAYVDADLAQARQVGANGTPTFFVNGEKIVGAQPVENFKKLIDQALSGRQAPLPTIVPSRRPSNDNARIVAKNTIAVGNSPVLGPMNAPITITEFSDFECPFCARGANTIKQIQREYSKQVRVVFKHLPLSFHKNAHLAAQASMAAHAQGKFWEYHDKLFQNFRNLNRDNFIKWAKELGLDTARFTQELDGGKYKAAVDADLALAGQSGANGTPTFIINGRKVVGAQPFANFKKVIDEILDGKAAPQDDAPRRPQAPKGQPSRKTIAVGGAPSFGPANAKVTIFEFSDFECPFCQRGANTMTELKKRYGNKIRVVFKHLPLSFHKNAHLAAQASMAAHAQGKFWEYHDKLFQNFRSLNRDNFIKWAKELGLDTARFTQELDGGKYKAFVDADLAQARQVGANGTPTFFVNGIEVVGAQPAQRFAQIIDAELSGKPVPMDAPPQRPQAPKGPVKVAIGDAPTLGSANAKVTIVEFSDFECPFCQRGANTMTALKKEYGDKIRIVFKHLPLSFHKNAHLAAQASMAAHAQGKFWEYHDKLFQNFRSLNRDNFIKWAKELGLDAARFTQELDGGKYKAFVDADLKQAGEVGANGTPTFYVNGIQVVGAQPVQRFKQIIDAQLSGKPVPQEAPPQRPQAPKPGQRTKIAIGGAPSFGPANAKITIVEFSDFECPFCQRGANTMTALKKEYGDKIRVVFKHLPLSFHKNAHLAAQASMAAHAQGKFWEYHDKLFQNFRSLNRDNFIKWAKELGLDAARFTQELDGGKYKAFVDADLKQAGEVGADGTPTFYVNGLQVVGAQPIQRFKQIIDAELSGKPVPQEAPPQAPQAPKGPVKIAIGDAPTLGPANAPVTIVEYSDFECPFCQRGANTVTALKKEYGDKIRVVFKHLPLPFHQNAHLAAQASMAAHAQGKFWEYHDKLFQNFRSLNRDNFVKWAQELGLDVEKFKKELDGGKYKDYVDADLKQAGEVGANGTPTFYINGNQLVGAQPIDSFKKMVDAELAKVKAPAPR